MKDFDFIKELIDRARSKDFGYFQCVHLVSCTLDKQYHEQLEQLVNGPIYDGDVISKSDRDILLNIGLAVRVCCKGEDGFTGATYFAYSVIKRIKEIKEGKVMP